MNNMFPQTSFESTLMAFAETSVSYNWVLLLCSVACIGLVVYFSKRQDWASFAQRNKKLSRIIQFILLSLILVPPALMMPTMLWGMPGLTLNFENPNLTASALKLGMYSLRTSDKIKSQLPPQQAALVDCIIAVSNADATEKQNKCGTDKACLENLSPMTKAEIIEQIKKSLTTYTPLVSRACKTIDIDTL